MTAAARAAAIAVTARARVESDRERNRREMPAVTAWLDQMRAVYGKLPAGSVTEGGRTVTWGVMPIYSYAAQASANYKPASKKR